MTKEVICSDRGVPLTGYDAFYQGWKERGNPHPKGSVEYCTWMSEWWRANAEAYKAHLEGAVTMGKELGR